MGSGLIFGKGYLKGTQGQSISCRNGSTDFAFSVLAEEWGFLGSVLLVVCYFFMILWGLNIAISARDKFWVLLAFGVVSLIFWQAFINLAMVMGLLARGGSAPAPCQLWRIFAAYQPGRPWPPDEYPDAPLHGLKLIAVSCNPA